MTESKPSIFPAEPIAGIGKIDAPQGLRAFAYEATHPAVALWLTPEHGLLVRLAAQLQARGAHPARTLVLLPYAQLLPLATRLWARLHPDGFAPRFETTLNWVASLGGQATAATDICFDAALDLLTAQDLLSQVGSPPDEGLASMLVQAAYQLAPLAAAAGPDQRAAWASDARGHAVLGLTGPALAWEAQVARVAVEWAAISGYATDALFDPAVQATLDCLVLVQGLAADPLPRGLASVWGERLLVLPLVLPEAPAATTAPAIALHACGDAEDEAQRSAACILAHIAAQQFPVALVSSDRALTRRVRAMLEAAGVQMRDENGWKLSTSSAAAGLMGLLRAAAWNANCDTVLSLMKRAPSLQAQVDAVEAALRRDQVRDWRHIGQSARLQQDAEALACCAQLDAQRGLLGGRRPLGAWLALLQQVLQNLGMWEPLVADAAGVEVLAALRLQPVQPLQWDALLASASWSRRRLDLSEFTAWVNQALEAASYQPAYPQQEELVILPMSQMLARPFAAVVLAGCDEVRLSPSPEPAGQWTPAQRRALGLPTREALDAQLRAAWQHALQAPRCDVLWRSSDDSGETLLPSNLVQLLLLQGDAAAGADPRSQRTLTPQPTTPPLPSAPSLYPATLSASGYEDLRTCPYRYFAMRLLGLQSSEELDTDVDKRDFGVWLHAVLLQFHEALSLAPTSEWAQRSAMLDGAAAQVSAATGLPEAEFLPYAAAWPALRKGYLNWLAKHEGQGAVFVSGETRHQQGLGTVNLVGRIDRMDRLPDGQMMVLDYKTEPLARTRERVKEPLEDTQIAFYAALLPNDSLRAAYLNIAERDGRRDGTVACEQLEIGLARDALVQGIQDDLGRIAQGAAMPALGDGPACEFCHARGLCRKDFWS